MRHLVILCVVAVLTALSVVLPAQAQVRFGLKGGLELTQMEFSSTALRESNRAGFYVGPQVKFQLPVVGLGVDVAALYNRRDVKVGGQSVEGETITQQSLLIPANVRYGVNIGDLLGVFLCTGPQFSFNLGKDVFYWYDDVKDNNHQYSLQNTLLSMNFGGGVNIGPNLEATIYYNVPLGKTADFTWDGLRDELKKNETWSRAKSRINAWHIALSYYF